MGSVTHDYGRHINYYTGLPCSNPRVYRTRQGTPFLSKCGLAVVAKTVTFPRSILPFLDGYGEGDWNEWPENTDGIPDGAMLAKTAGQLCYLSFDKKGTPHSQTQKYLDHIKESRHGSVLEHASISVLFWGIDRAVTHELVRHRAGFAFSQISQRFVDNPRFVLSPEYAESEALIEAFYEDIDRAQVRYELRAKLLMEQNPLPSDATREQQRDHRKRVNSAARRVLPNETEAPILVTANLRGWRHFIEQRDSRWADLGIRLPADELLWALRHVEPEVFSDYEPAPEGGVTTKYSKV